MNHRCENVDPQRDGMDEEIERAIQKGTISWKMIHRDSWPDHPEYKAKVYAIASTPTDARSAINAFTHTRIHSTQTP